MLDHRRFVRFGLTLVELLVVVAILSLVIAIILPAVQKIRQSAALAHSQNNLKQIGLGFHSLATAESGSLPGHRESWNNQRFNGLGPFISLLPSIDRSDLFSQFATDKWAVLKGQRLPVKTFINPLDPSLGTRNLKLTGAAASPGEFSRVSASSYALNAKFWFQNPQIGGVSDGSSNTVWIAEHYAYNCGNTTFTYLPLASTRWDTSLQPAMFAMEPAMGRPAPGDYVPVTTGNPPVSTAANGVTFQLRPTIDACDPRQPNASYSGGLQVGMADGSVRIVRHGISPAIFWGAVTPAGGEVLGDW